MTLTGLIGIVIAGVITNNIVLVQSIGICPFLGVSKKLDSSLGMGLAVTFVLIIASVVCYVLYYYAESGFFKLVSVHCAPPVSSAAI